MPKIKDLGIKVIPETMRPLEVGGGAGCGALTIQCGCTNITNPCFGCTFNLTIPQCPFHTITPCGHCTNHYTICNQCTHQGSLCLNCTIVITHPCLCTHIGSIPTPWTIIERPTELSKEQIATLKDQLQKSIVALDEQAKASGGRTVEEIDAREKALNEELAQLKARRKELNK